MEIDENTYPWSPFAQTVLDECKRDPEFMAYTLGILEEYFAS